MSRSHDRSLITALNALGFGRALVVIVVLVLAGFWLGVAVVFGLTPVGPGLTNRLGGVAAGDFMFFYPVSTLAAHSRAPAVYDPAVLTAAAQVELGAKVPQLVWPYPPSILLPLSAFGHLAPATALACWVGTAVCALLVLGRVLLGHWRLAPLVLLFPGSALALFTGQVSPVLALAFGLMAHWSSKSPDAAGTALGLMTVKPHLAVAPLLLAFDRRAWTLVRTAAIVGILLAGASVLVFGTHTWTAFWEAGLQHAGRLGSEIPAARLVTAFGAAFTFDGHIQVAVVVHAMAALIVLVAAGYTWRHSTSPSLRALGLAVATLEVTPYAFDYDLVFLVVPWLLMIRESYDDPDAGRAVFGLWVVLALTAPVSYLLSIYTARSTASIPLIGLALAAAWSSRPSALSRSRASASSSR